MTREANKCECGEFLRLLTENRFRRIDRCTDVRCAKQYTTWTLKPWKAKSGTTATDVSRIARAEAKRARRRARRRVERALP